MSKISKKLKIYIAGIPEGVRVAVFNENIERDNTGREIINKLATSEGTVEADIDISYNNVPIKVVVRSAGFLPYEYQDKIESGIGLFHAAKLEVDRVYNGDNTEMSNSWDSALEHRRAEQKVQSLYRQFRKNNPRERIIKSSIDIGAPIIGALIGAPFGVIGIFLGLIIGYIAGYFSSKYTLKAMGLD